jgi:hypothetical protein
LSIRNWEQGKTTGPEVSKANGKSGGNGKRMRERRLEGDAIRAA